MPRKVRKRMCMPKKGSEVKRKTVTVAPTLDKPAVLNNAFVEENTEEYSDHGDIIEEYVNLCDGSVVLESTSALDNTPQTESNVYLDDAFVDGDTCMQEAVVEEDDLGEKCDKVCLDNAFVEGASMQENDEFGDCANFARLYSDLCGSMLSDKYTLRRRTSTIQIVEFYDTSDIPSVKLSLDIKDDFTCDIYVHRKHLSHTHDLWDTLPSHFTTVKDVLKLLDRLDRFRVCMGNPDTEYTSMTAVGTGLSDNKEPGILAYHEGDFHATLGNLHYSGTIRTVNCDLLVDGNRCSGCRTYRRYLRERQRRLEERKDKNIDFLHSTFKHKDMSRENLITKVDQQKDYIKDLQQQIHKIQRECDKSISKHGILLEKHENIEFRDLMMTCQPDIEKAFPDASCRQRLFWSQQLKRINTDPRAMRWHPMVIRWCLFLRQKSAKAYEALRDSGFVTLPSSRTLFDYSHYINSELGFQKDVFVLLKEEAEKKKLYDAVWRSYVGLLFDEIKVKEDLVYDKHTGELIGYCNLDAVGNEMMELERIMCTKSSSGTPLAKYMLVVMLRSLAADFKFPVCGFATQSITSDFLYPILWKTVSTIERHLKLRVLFFTCDGASPNRRFFNLHRVGNEDFVFKTVNPFDFERNIYFISDVPHLLKTVRNCFSNSFWHKQTRHLWKNGRDISWVHIVKLFQEHCELSLFNPCPKLTHNHINLVSYNYMKVNLAAQVCSDSVANALEELYGDEVSETVTFIRHINKFFDCLNVRSLYEGRNKRNPNLGPYRSSTDERLSYLMNTFLGYLEEWDSDVKNRPGNYAAADKASMLLSHQTVTGLKITVNSICACIKLMLNAGAEFMFTHSFNQDPLEQHFGHYRHLGGANNNPSVYQVRNMMTTLRTVGAQALPPRQGNIRRHGLENDFIDNAKLPRRNRHANS